MAIEVEELAQRVSHLEGRYDGIADDVKDIKIDIKAINQNLKMLYEKSERDKTEFVERIEATKTELKTEFVERIETTKTDLIKWMVGISATFTVITITAIWAILSFAIPTKTVSTDPAGNPNEIIEKTVQPPVE
ncbi:MAG: hypothetical protein FVQ77_11380 [Cytophagales bacterium]|nr:hypothetical protein [Cytophagales bacterium]